MSSKKKEELIVEETPVPMTKVELESHGFTPEQKSWQVQFHENYTEVSPEAQSLKPFLKYNFNNNAYLPWAVMERLTYMQDPNAVFYKDLNIITNKLTINTVTNGTVTQVDVFAHFVRVILTFMGKTFEEIYPIQDKAYNAPKAYDQNMVNKAYQRAIAKVASRGTGLGLRLYENQELQFEEAEGLKKPELPQAPFQQDTPSAPSLTVPPQGEPIPATPSLTVPVKRGKATTEKIKYEKSTVRIPDEPQATGHAFEEPEPVVEPSVEPVSEPTVEPIAEPSVSIAIDENDTVGKIIELLKDDKYVTQINAILRSFNPVLFKQYGYTIATTDSVDELREKLNKLPDPTKFLANLERIKG